MLCHIEPVILYKKAKNYKHGEVVLLKVQMKSTEVQTLGAHYLMRSSLNACEALTMM